MAVQCQKNVVQFQITVDDTVFMEVFQRQAHLSSVEPIKLVLEHPGGRCLRNLLCAFCPKLTTLNVPHEISTANILHYEINSRLGLETSMQIQQEGVMLFVCDQEDSLL